MSEYACGVCECECVFSPISIGQTDASLPGAGTGRTQLLHGVPPAGQQVPHLAGWREMEEGTLLHTRPVTHEREPRLLRQRHIQFAVELSQQFIHCAGGIEFQLL